MVKAVAGGGGRGMRPVTDPGELAAALERCRSEAERAFGDGTLFLEELMPRARHVEVQVIGDGTGPSATCGTASAASSGAGRRSWRSHRP